MKCWICVELARRGDLLNLSVQPAITIMGGFAICEKHIEVASNCVSPEDAIWRAKAEMGNRR